MLTTARTVLLSFPLALPLSIAACASSLPRAPVAAGRDETAARIARIERSIFPGARVQGETGTTIEERMKAHRVNGLSVAVFQDFRIVWAKGYGVADVETRAPVTETTLFQAGSISKPVATMAALKAVADGKLSLDANINDALTSWKLPASDFTRDKPVTLRAILSHTAGIGVHGFGGYAAGEPVPTLLQVLDGATPANSPPIRVELAPGTKFRYSGGGMTVMQQALIDVTKKPFPQILAETVLGPIGMSHSSYEQPLRAADVRLAATGCDIGGGSIEGKRHVYPEMAAAGLWTTPSDLARFAIELALASEGKSARVLSQADAQRMLTKVAATDDPDSDVALGVFLRRRGATTYFGHDGADAGFQASLVANVKGYGVAMMTNSDAGEQLMDEVLPAIAAEYGWEGFPDAITPAKLSPSRLAELAGSYQVHPDRILRLAVEGDHLALRTPFLPAQSLVPISDTTFVSRTDPARYVFSRGADGRVQIQISPPPGEWPYAKRVDEAFTVPLDDAAAGRLDEAAARYRVASANAPNDPSFAEERFNAVGVSAVFRGDFPSAILLFRLNVALHPDSMNTYDSLGWAYSLSGDQAQAIAAYRRSLAAFDRDTTLPAAAKEGLRKNALEALKKLGVGH